MMLRVSRPPRVRIDDLTHPRFSPEIEALRDAMVPMAAGLQLEPGALLEAACTQTGLDDFGDHRFREPLDVLCRAWREDADLSPGGVVSTHTQLVQFLVNRLLLQNLLKRHPEIHDVVIDRPIFVTGLPRTGTTHLHNLLSADPALRSLPYWESLEPIPLEAERDQDPDPRIARCGFGLDVMHQAMPYFVRMHEMTVDHAHEEIHLLAMDLSTMYFETLAGPIPSYRDWYTATDQTPSYRYLRTILQALQWLRGGTRWVLKSPQHLEQFGPLLAAFPDATVAVSHRDPVSVTTSLCTMLAYTSRMSLATIDLHAIGRYWADRVRDLFAACVRDRDLLPDDGSIDVRFHEFMADDMAMVRRIYDRAEQPLDRRAAQAMETYVMEHPRGRHGTVVYDLAQFGLDERELRDALRFYIDRFGIEEEPSG
jgi:hypothetical protein